MIDPKLVRMATYETSDGTRLLFFGPNEAEFESLKSCFHELSLPHTETSIKLHDLPWVYASQQLKVSMFAYNAKLHGSFRKGEMGIHRERGDPVSNRWLLTKDDWQQLEWLLDGLLKSSGAGHQYLTLYPSEDAEAVVSKGEYADDVFEVEQKRAICVVDRSYPQCTLM